jgi:heat shock protein HtpX
MSTSPSPVSPNGPARTGVASLNIYDAIAANRRRTNLLIASFVLLVAGVTGVLGLYVGGDVIVSGIVAGVGAAIAVLIALLVYRKGSDVVMAISHAREVSRSEQPELHRVIENLCIGAGLPMPKVYVIEDSAPNAFATGRDPQHAAVAITTGLLDKLEPLELEGVMAHELSHIRNLDTRIMVVTAVLVGFIVLLSDVMLRSLWFGGARRSRSRNQGGNAGQAIVLVLVLVTVVLAPLLARIIRLSISRQREYLADASAALLTRYPEGLASALEKLEADTEPLEAANKATEHLYIVNPLKGHESALNGLFHTHPPIDERVARLRAMSGRV